MGALDFDLEKASCLDCKAVYRIDKGKIYFVEMIERSDALDDAKGSLKRILGKYYYKIGVNLFAPTFPFNYSKTIRKWLTVEEQIVIDIGCGNHRLDESIIGLDLFDYDAADLVCDLNALPFKSNSVDGFVSRSVLEHVPNLDAVVAQFHRCTKPGGLSIHLIPFLYPFHASPYDFQRYTHKGQEMLFKEWKLRGQTNPTGPVTLALVCLIEFLSILFSLGNEKLRGHAYLAFCGLLFPLKFLDFPFVNRKIFLTMAPSILAVFSKLDT